MALVLALGGGCATRPTDGERIGKHRCESFLIYSICIADRDTDGYADYIYFGDDFQVFMYREDLEVALRAVEPFHVCAVPMSAETRDLSSRLLYSEGLSLSERLSVKGRLLGAYRKAQPAVDACNEAQGLETMPMPTAPEDDPFIADDDWDEAWEEPEPLDP